MKPVNIIIKIRYHDGIISFEFEYDRNNNQKKMDLTLQRTITQTKEELEIAARRTILEMEYVFNHPLTKENKKNLELEVLREEKNLTNGSVCAILVYGKPT